MGYQHDGDGKVGVATCLKPWTQVKELYYHLWKKKNQPLDGMVILTPDGPIENVAIEMSNILMEGEHVPTFQVEGIWICNVPHPWIAQRFLINLWIMTPKPFDRFHHKRN